MTTRRVEKVNDQLRAEISDLIGREMKDPRLRGLVSVTTVETTPDLRHARVFISVLGSEEERAESLATLRRAAGFFRHELGLRLRMKRTPDVDFRLDLSIERGAHLMSLIRKVQLEAESTDTAEDTPSSAIGES